MNVGFHPTALEELKRAAQYYKLKGDQLEEQFLDEFDTAFSKVLATPQRFVLVNRNTRRCNLQRFPYSIFYRESGDVVRIIAIRHHSQDLGDALDRM